MNGVGIGSQNQLVYRLQTLNQAINFPIGLQQPIPNLDKALVRDFDLQPVTQPLLEFLGPNVTSHGFGHNGPIYHFGTNCVGSPG